MKEKNTQTLLTGMRESQEMYLSKPFFPSAKFLAKNYTHSNFTMKRMKKKRWIFILIHDIAIEEIKFKRKNFFPFLFLLWKSFRKFHLFFCIFEQKSFVSFCEVGVIVYSRKWHWKWRITLRTEQFPLTNFNLESEDWNNFTLKSQK